MPMLAALLLGVLPVQAELRTIDLYRGAVLPNQAFRYWDVTDTYLSAGSPEVAYGGDGTLLGGSGKNILVKFGDLGRVVRGGKITAASIILTPSGGNVPELRGASRLLVPFGEGPVNTIGSLLEKSGIKTPVPPPLWASTWKTRRGGVNWGWQTAGAMGAADATPIAPAKLVDNGQTISVTGLEEAAQYMADHPEDNHGFALQFANETEFFSSNTPIGRPTLHLEITPAPPKSGPDLSVIYIEEQNRGAGQTEKFVAHVKNVGDGASAGFTAKWIVDEHAGADAPAVGSLDAGKETTLTYERPYTPNPKDHRTQPIGLVIVPNGPDAKASNDHLTVAADGRVIRVAVKSGQPGVEDAVQAQVRFFNETMAPQSRYSFAREGALERVVVTSIQDAPGGADLVWNDALGTDPDPAFQRAIGKAIGMTDLSMTAFPPGERNQLAARGSLDAYPGLYGYGDTRFDGTILGTLAMLYEPYSSPMFDVQPLEATGLLSATDVIVLNGIMDGQSTAEQVLNRTTPTVILHAMDIGGRPLGGMELSFFQSKNGQISDDAPAFTVVTDRNGAAYLPNRDGGGPFGKVAADGGNGTFLVRASANGVTEWGWLKFWQLVDSLHRGGTGATVFDMRFNLPGAPLEANSNLAADRTVADSTGQLPAALAPLLDGKGSTTIELPKKAGDWIEIDLGRDRTIGEIDLTAFPGQMWQKFDILVYATGTEANVATLWAKEVDWKWTSSNRRDLIDGIPSVAYRGLPLRIRYIRIVSRVDGGGQLGEVRIVAAQA